MPALLFMGRRWGVGADEFALPSLCSMALRVIWSIALVVVLFQVGGDLRGCNDGWVVYTYMVCSLSTFALSVVVEWGITRVSTRGSIPDTRLRDHLSGYLNVHMMLGAVQLVMAGLGIGLMTYLDSTCEGVLADGALNVLILVVTISQIVDVLVTCCCCVLMSGDPEEAYGGGSEGHYERFPPTEIEGQWESRCHWLHRVLVVLTCGLFGGRGIRQTDFEQLSKIMARIFHTEEYLDVVPSDIAAGIVLLYHKQRQQRRALASSYAGARQRSSPAASSTLRSSLLPSAGPLAVPPPPTSSGLGWGGGDDTEDPSLRSCCSSSGRGEEGGSGERASLTTGGGGDAVGVGGGGAFRLPIGVRERSKRHDDFYRVEGLQVLDVTNGEDRSALEEISHFSRYALAIYTWYLYVFERPCCGACDLLCYSCTGRSRAFHRTRSSKKDWGNTTSTTTTSAAGGSNGATAAAGIDSKGRGGRSTMRNKTEKDSGGGGGNVGGGPGGVGGPGVSVRGDNWLGTHEAALLRVAGLHRGCEVVDAHFASGVVETPYCVLVDHAWRCVVVSIRGTMSLDDCLCDLQAEPACMEESGKRWGFDGRGMYAHEGVLARAEWVRKDLEDQGHIRALLLGGGPAGEEGAPQRVASVAPGGGRRTPPRFRDYSLRVTGHSLGGSTGALLAYMLRWEYPSVRCVAISPLGGLLNSPHAENCGEFVLSSALGEDVVPRLSVLAMERMRDEVLELIARTKANKLTVMRSMVRAVSFSRDTGPSPSPRSSSTGFGGCGGCGGGGDSGRDLEHGDDLGGLVYGQDEPVPETRFSSQLRRYRALVDQKRAASPFPELLPAGRFVHYIKTHTNRSCCIRHWLYTPVWAKPTDFRDIVVSKRMFFDHIPTKSSPRFTETYQMLIKETREAVASGLPGRGPAEGGKGVGEGTVGAMGISMGRSGT